MGKRRKAGKKAGRMKGIHPEIDGEEGRWVNGTLEQMRDGVIWGGATRAGVGRRLINNRTIGV